MAIKIRAIVPISKKETLDAVQSLTVSIGPAKKKNFGFFASVKFGASASLRERLAVARRGSVYRRIWELTETDQIQKLLKGDADFIHESVTDEDINTIDSVCAFVLSAPANDFTLVALDVSWPDGTSTLTNTYRAFQGVRSCLEGILWGIESRRMPQIPGFILLSKPYTCSSVEENILPAIASQGKRNGRLDVETAQFRGQYTY